MRGSGASAPRQPAPLSDAQWTALIDSKKKSGWIAALLNLVIPGAGYIYCGRYFLGIVAFIFVVCMWAVFLAAWAIFGVFAGWSLALMLFIDGFLCARRYNREMIETELGR